MSGLSAPTASISRSESSRSFGTSLGRLAASVARAAAVASSASRFTSVPPCGAIWCGLGHGPTPLGLRWARASGPGSSRPVGGPEPGERRWQCTESAEPQAPRRYHPRTRQEASATRVQHLLRRRDPRAEPRVRRRPPPRDRGVGARDVGHRADRDRLRLPGRRIVRDAHGVADQARRADPVPRDRVPVRRDPGVQGTAHRTARPQRGRPLRRVHGGEPGRGLRPPAVRARPRRVLRPEQGAADDGGAARARRVGHGLPPGFVADAGRRAVRGPLRGRAGPTRS